VNGRGTHNSLQHREQAPEGRPSLAQRFSAGKTGANDSSPGGTTEFSRTSSRARHRVATRTPDPSARDQSAAQKCPADREACPSQLSACGFPARPEARPAHDRRLPASDDDLLALASPLNQSRKISLRFADGHSFHERMLPSRKAFKCGTHQPAVKPTATNPTPTAIVIAHFFTFSPGREVLGPSYFTYAGSISEPLTNDISDL
jgi:hypothetical protein